jgi:hypothetical protein
MIEGGTIGGFFLGKCFNSCLAVALWMSFFFQGKENP